MRIAPGKSQRPVQPVIGFSRPSFAYMFPTSEGIANALTAPSRIQTTRPTTPPSPSPVCCFVSSWRLVGPVQAVDTERDDEEEDAEADPAGAAQGLRGLNRLRRFDRATQAGMAGCVKRRKCAIVSATP